MTVTVTTPPPATTAPTTTLTGAAAATGSTATGSTATASTATASAAADASTESAITNPWSATLGTDSATLLAQSQLNETVDSHTPPASLIPIYKAAASVFGVPWQILAAINAVESD